MRGGNCWTAFADSPTNLPIVIIWGNMSVILGGPDYLKSPAKGVCQFLHPSFLWRRARLRKNLFNFF